MPTRWHWWLQPGNPGTVRCAAVSVGLFAFRLVAVWLDAPAAEKRTAAAAH